MKFGSKKAKLRSAQIGMLSATSVMDLEKKLGYTFNERHLLGKALTHSSLSTSEKGNERLEFLGDAVLGLVLSQVLVSRLPAASEGHLSRLRSFLVKAETLTKLAKGLSLGNHLILGAGEKKSQGANRASTLADALEALIGSVFLDSGFEVAKTVILRLYEETLNKVLQKPVTYFLDPKSVLQELAQAQKLNLPKYNMQRREGLPPQEKFTVACILEIPKIRVEGQGRAVRYAEQAAAVKAIKELKIWINNAAPSRS